MQDNTNQLFSSVSIGERGTQLRNAFGHRNVTTDVINCFNYVDDFSRFTTEAQIIYLALNILQMKDINSDPGTSIPRGIQMNDINSDPGTSIPRGIQKSRSNYIDTVWCDVDEVIEAEVKNNQIDKWCFCNDDGNMRVVM